MFLLLFLLKFPCECFLWVMFKYFQISLMVSGDGLIASSEFFGCMLIGDETVYDFCFQS